MTKKEQLWYLIEGVLNNTYNMETFCNEFTRIYDLEVNYDELSSSEKIFFRKLSELTSRFSDNKEELAIPNVYCGEKEILELIKRELDGTTHKEFT